MSVFDSTTDGRDVDLSRSRNLLRDIIQDAHVNVLLGAGASLPDFRALGNVEELLTQVSTSEGDEQVKMVARCAILRQFFLGTLAPNMDLPRRPADYAVVASYARFLRTMNAILLRRQSTLLSKQANLFTTNVDIAIEVAAEALQLEINDGFSGRFNPIFNLGNFGTIKSRQSSYYDNVSPVPVMNLLKIHGSSHWRADYAGTDPGDAEAGVVLDSQFKTLREVEATLRSLPTDIPEVGDADTADGVIAKCIGVDPLGYGGIEEFLTAYDRLAIVNPTKEKFSITVLTQNYYDLLRLFSNALEKENSVLIVIGFSCRDEHIRSLIRRSAHSNPTLRVLVFAYSDDEAEALLARLHVDRAPNANIEVIGPGRADSSDPLSLDVVREQFLDKIAFPTGISTDEPDLTARLA